MFKHPRSCLRLAQTAGLFATLLAGSASAGIPGDDPATTATLAATACGTDNSRALADAPENLCRAGTASALSGNGPWTWTCSDGQHESRCGANAAAHYNYRTFDYPDASRTIVWGLDDFGDFSGEYRTGGTVSHAWLYRHGRFQSLDPEGLFGDRFAAGGGPNDLGTVFGAYTDSAGLQHGFQIPWGYFETVDVPGHLNSNVDGVNLFGAIALVYWDADNVKHGALRRYGRYTTIDVPNVRETYPLSISDNGEILGFYDDDPNAVHGFYRDARGRYSTIDVPNAAGTAAFATNAAGRVAGYYYDATFAFHGFVEKNGQFDYLDMPGAVSTYATSINNLGVVGGYYEDAANTLHGFVATPW